MEIGGRGRGPMEIEGGREAGRRKQGAMKIGRRGQEANGNWRSWPGGPMEIGR